MTENKSPGDRLLELVVFAPAGLAVTLVEEFPKFVEKGRHRVEGQVHTARLVGQFAFQMGRRQFEQSFGNLGHSPHAHAPDAHVPDAHAPDAHVPDVDAAGNDDAAAADAHSGVRQRDLGHAASAASADRAHSAGPAPADGTEGADTSTPWHPSVWLGGGGPNGSGAPESLAIPGYDSLSASQVVQRLEGLSSPELEEVRAHEAAHRQRRTILHRVEQLLAGGDDVAP